MTDQRVGSPRGITRAPLNVGKPIARRSIKTPVPQRSSSPTAAKQAVFEIKSPAPENHPPGKAVLAAANKYLGIPYEMGGGRGAGPIRTFDCSSFVARVISDATGGRAKLTSYTDAMYDETVAISQSEAQPGDLVFYRFGDPGQPGTRFPHVAIYAGNGQVVDASSTTGKVSYHPIGQGIGGVREFRRVSTTPSIPS